MCDQSGVEAVSWGHRTAKTRFLCHSDTFPTKNVRVTFRSPQGAMGRPGHLIKYNETGYNHEASRWQDFSDRNCNRDRLRPATTDSSRASPRVRGRGQKRRHRLCTSALSYHPSESGRSRGQPAVPTDLGPHSEASLSIKGVPQPETSGPPSPATFSRHARCQGHTEWESLPRPQRKAFCADLTLFLSGCNANLLYVDSSWKLRQE